MKDAREALSVPATNVTVKKEVTIEVEDEDDTDVRMLSVEPRIQKKKSTPRRSARAHASK